jgi:hypothetical protein
LGRKFFLVGRLLAWSTFFQKWKVGFLGGQILAGKIFSGGVFFLMGSFSGDFRSTWQKIQTAVPLPYLARKVAQVIYRITIPGLPRQEVLPLLPTEYKLPGIVSKNNCQQHCWQLNLCHYKNVSI